MNTTVTENDLEDMIEYRAIDDHLDVNATFCMERCRKAPNVSVGSINIEKASFEKVVDIIEKQLKNSLMEV
jgi:NADH:ubiquinone oxidoreductase subunit E